MLKIVENQLVEDKERKLIMTLINIEKMRENDLFFGVHSLLSIVQCWRLPDIHFSKRLLFCLWEYGEITGSLRLAETFCDSLSGLTYLTHLNIPHVATDRIVFTVSRYLTLLTNLDLSSSRVTDRGLNFLSGGFNLTSDRVQRNVVRNLSNYFHIVPDIRVEDLDVPESQTDEKTGCYLLERISLLSCDGVTETGVGPLMVLHLVEIVQTIQQVSD